MQFSNVLTVLALAATAFAGSNDTIVYTTITVDSYTTYCPASAVITFNGQTYTNTETVASSITITNCPCTVSAPVYTTSSVICSTCAVASASASPIVYTNATTAATSPVTVATVAPTTKVSAVATTAAASATATPSSIVGSGANKAFAMSGASLAGLLALAAYIL